MYELHLLGADGVVARHRLTGRRVHLGRGGTNDLVVFDDTVSSRHLAVWVAGDACWIEDLQSRNGTWVNGARVSGAVRLTTGDQLRVGERTTFVLVCAADDGAHAPYLEDLDTTLRHALSRDRFVIGPAPADIVVPSGSATVMVHRNGEIWLGTGPVLVELESDRPFLVEGRRFCLRRPPAEWVPTRESVTTPYPYVLCAALEGAGPRVTLRDTRAGRTHAVVADNRALLLYLLARKIRDDLATGSQPEDAGWCSDDEVAVGIWGRAQAIQQLGNLNVLVWRVRRELTDAGFDGWCIEKRRRHLRMRAERVEVR